MKISNKLLGFFFNKLDAPIRFLYSQFHLNKFLFWKLYASNIEKLDQEFEDMKTMVHSSNYTFEKKICLELGPGNSYISAFNFLQNGAKKVILVDKYPRFFNTQEQADRMQKELSFIKNKYNDKQLNFMKGAAVDSEYIEFISKDVTDLSMVEYIDFVYSISVLEHIKNVEGIINKFSDIVKKGGLMYHSIDMRDHYNFSNPFLFLKYSNSTWGKYLTKEGVSYTNRMRYSEYRRLLIKYGFEIIGEKLIRYSLSNQNISVDFDIKSQDINVGIAKVMCVKK